jgi:prevent-host-death family protein
VYDVAVPPTTMSVTEARAALPEILDRVRAGEEITLTRHGEAVAVVVRPDRLRARRSEKVFEEAARLGELLAEGRQTPLGQGPGISEERAEELLAEVRAGRESR